MGCEACSNNNYNTYLHLWSAYYEQVLYGSHFMFASE